LSFWSTVNRSNRALVKMRFDADVNQRRESGCDEDGENNGHITTLKPVLHRGMVSDEFILPHGL